MKFPDTVPSLPLFSQFCLHYLFTQIHLIAFWLFSCSHLNLLFSCHYNLNFIYEI